MLTEVAEGVINELINIFFRFQFPINDSFWSMQLLIDIEMQELVLERDNSAQLNYPFAVPIGASYSCSADSYNNYTASGKNI